MRLVGAKAIAQAAGTAMSSAEQRRAAGDDDRVQRVVEIVAALLHDRRSSPCVQWKNRNFGGIAKASSSVLKLVSTIQRIGKKIRKPTTQAAIGDDDLARGRDAAWPCAQASRFLPTMRTRKKATMLARTTATMPPAEAPPTSNCSSACWIDQEGEVGGRVARSAAGGDEDLGEDGEQEDRLDQDDDGDRPREMRQHDVEEERRAAARRPSRAASFCSSSSDCSAVSRMSVANGSHCQATIRMIDEQRRVGEPVDRRAARASFAIQANSPETGCISRFFQTSALTVGMTKNGAITISRTMPRPKNGWSISSASSDAAARR